MMRGAWERSVSKRMTRSSGTQVQRHKSSEAPKREQIRYSTIFTGLSFEPAATALRPSLSSTLLLTQPIQGFQSLEVGQLRTFIRPAGKVRRAGGSASGEQQITILAAPQNYVSIRSSEDTTQYWDNKRSKPTPQHPDCRLNESKVPLWPKGQHKPVGVYSQLTTMDAGFASAQRPSAVAATESESEVGMHRNLWENGLTSDAVDALDLQVQRGCHVRSNLLYRVLKRCIQDKDLALGRRIHALTVKSGYEGDPFLATHLMCFYASFARLEEAMDVFTKVPTPDAYNWATIISAYARPGAFSEAREAIRLYRKMCETTTVKPMDRLFSAVLKACATAKDLVAGKEVHAHMLATSWKPDRFVQAGLVNMYSKCGSLEDARRLFENLSDRDVVTWTAMIAGYAKQGMGQEALNLYRSMQEERLTRPNTVTYVCLLQACSSIGVKALDVGKQLHAEIKARGLQKDVVLGGSLVNMYAKCGSLEEARLVFDNLPNKDLVTWTALIAGYAQQGMGQEALSLRRSLQQLGLTPADPVTYVCLLQACASVGSEAIDEGRQLHAQVKELRLQEDGVLGVSLVNMYAKCCCLEDARSVFDRLPEKNVVAWNAMITGYAQQGMGQEALNLYDRMQKEGLTPDCVTYVSLLQACASVGVGALSEGKQLHEQIKALGLEKDLVVGGSLVNMHAKCGTLEDARMVFENLPRRNLVTWTTMIAGYAQQGMGQDALSLHGRMQLDGQTPDSVTYVCLLQACASIGVGAIGEGKLLHAQMKQQALQEDVVLGGSLVDMYVKCGSLEDARAVFNELARKDVVTWTAMIAGYAQQGMGQEALNLYSCMQQVGLAPDSVTYVCLLQACAAVAALPLGQLLHAEIKKRGKHADGTVGASLVNMYAKCGSMYDAQQVFTSLSERSLEAWDALVSGYARQGDSQVVFDLVDKMRSEGIYPKEITFLSVLTVCSHVGLVDKGRKYFTAMKDYGINATMEHYISMVDLLGRAGHLDEALQMAKAMPFAPNDVLWRTLLGACRKWKNVEIGQQAFEGAVSLNEKDATSYVLISNIYASCQMWEAAKEMQARRKKLGVWKEPGKSSWTDMEGVEHTFLVGDKKHPESDRIYSRLEELIPKLQKEGYAPHLESSLLDTTDDEKQAELWGHSEKLAIAYALKRTAGGTTIRIVKNLRVCEDCHTATAYISNVERRTIICRDASRFHVFKEGKCSCGDYW